MTHFLALGQPNHGKPAPEGQLLKLVLNGITSENFRRSYRTGLVAFFAWVRGREEPFFTKALVVRFQ
jgi:hypothetical protein